MGPTVAEVGVGLLAGSLTTLSPCVLPLIPLVLGGATQRSRLAPLALGLGMAASFAVVGVLLGTVGPALGIDGDAVRIVGGVLMIGAAVTLLSSRLSDLLARGLAPIAGAAGGAATRFSGQSPASAFALGALLGLVWRPCSGPLLGSALIMVGAEGGALRGGVILGAFGVGAAIPLVTLAIVTRSGFERVRGKVMRGTPWLKRGFALLLAASGIAVLTGIDKRIEAVVNDWLPDAWLRLVTLF